jgi:hypothetical protein
LSPEMSLCCMRPLSLAGGHRRQLPRAPQAHTCASRSRSGWGARSADTFPGFPEFPTRWEACEADGFRVFDPFPIFSHEKRRAVQAIVAGTREE